MKTFKIITVFLLFILPLLVSPKISMASGPKGLVTTSLPSQYDDLSYVCVNFKGFPFGVLWKLRGMASTIKQEIPEGLRVGREMKNGQGYLLFSYQKKTEGVLLSMRYQRLAGSTLTASTDANPMEPLTEQLLLSDNSTSRVIESLRALFFRFCLTWEQERIPSDLKEIMSSGIHIASSDPDPYAPGSLTFDR